MTIKKPNRSENDIVYHVCAICDCQVNEKHALYIKGLGWIHPEHLNDHRVFDNVDFDIPAIRDEMNRLKNQHKNLK